MLIIMAPLKIEKNMYYLITDSNRLPKRDRRWFPSLRACLPILLPACLPACLPAPPTCLLIALQHPVIHTAFIFTQ